MIISQKYKFVFIANAKTGTATIHKTLLKQIKDDKLIDESQWCLGEKHLSCSDLLKGRPWYKNYYFFTFVRNPWHRTLSWYFFSKKSNEKSRNTSKMSFEEFLLTRPTIWKGLDNQQKQFTAGCDFVGRTENLQNDFNTVCDKLKIPKVTLPQKNSTEHEHYTQYYNDQTRDIVAKAFRKDIEFFNFKYGE